MSDSKIYYGWVIVGLAFMMQALASGSTNALYGVFAVPFSEAFDTSRTQVLVATASVVMICSGLLSPLAGYWLGQRSPKTLILVGGSTLALGFLAATQATSLWHITLVYAVSCSVGGVLYGPLAANSSVSNWFVAQRGKALGIASIGMSLGTFCFPPLITWIITHHGWRSAYVTLAVLIAASLPLIMRFYRDGPEATSNDPPQAEPSGSSSAWREILSNRHFWLITICISICFAGFNGLTVNMIPMAIDQGINAQTASLLMSIGATFGVIGKLAIGFSADRLGARIALLLPLLALSGGIAMLWGGPGFPRLMLAASLIGLSSGGAIPVWGSLIGSYFGQRHFSLVMGMMNPLLVPLIVVCAPFVSWINEQYGSYNPALATLLCLIAVAIALTSLLQPIRQAPETAPAQNH